VIVRKIAFLFISLAISVNFTSDLSAQESAAANSPAVTPPTQSLQKVDEKVAVVGEQVVVSDEKVHVADASKDIAKSNKADPVQVEKVNVEGSENFLPPTSTRAWVSVKEVKVLKEKLANSDLGVLCKQESIRPFIDSIRGQLKDILKKNNIQFGIELDSLEELKTGEICVAGILPEVAGQQPKRGSHGIVVLVDVHQDENRALDLIKKASEKMVARGAKREMLPINGTDVEKLTFDLPESRLRKKRQSFAALVNGWLLASDNEAIFRDTLRRVSKYDATNPKENFGGQNSFKVIAERTSAEGIDSDIQWYVDPFGYAKFADSLAQQNRPIVQTKTGLNETLQSAGLDAIKSMGGSFSFATEKHEVLFRAMIYGPRKDAANAAQKRVFGFLDFMEVPGQTATPPIWVPEDASSYFTATWDLQRAFGNIGHFVDAIAGEEDTWSSILEKMKTVPKFRVDIAGIVEKLDNRITVMSLAEEPIAADSEKVVIGVKLKDLSPEDEDWLLESIGRAVQGKVKVLGGFKTIEDDPMSEEEEEVDDPLGSLDLDEFGDDEEEEEEKAPDLTILSQRYFAIKYGHLLVSNDKDYLKRMLLAKAEPKFADKADLIRVQDALAELTDEKRIRFRQFGRLDRILKPNYEMLRRGEMATSQTLFARVLNVIMSKDEEDPADRDQKINGSDLPENYDVEVAPYLGTSGWVMEIEDDGWRFTGCVLKKEGLVEKKEGQPDDEN
jgi:hypothetical protein